MNILNLVIGLDTLLDIPFNIYKTPKYLDTENTNKSI